MAFGSDTNKMRRDFVVLIMSLFLSNSWAVADELKSFSQGLDTTLRRLNHPEQCASTNHYPSAKKERYKEKSATALSPLDAEKLFQDMASHTELAFGFTYDGCALRSAEMQRLMLLQGIQPLAATIWVDTDKKPRLRFKHPQDSSKDAEWIQHLAPVILVREGKKTTPYVIDPSTQSGPVPFEAWKNTFTKHEKKMKVESDISEVIIDINNVAQNQDRAERLKRLKQYEGQPNGVEQYQSDVLMEQDDYEGKIDAMSSGN